MVSTDPSGGWQERHLDRYWRHTVAVLTASVVAAAEAAAHGTQLAELGGQQDAATVTGHDDARVHRPGPHGLDR
jgi:hypothetical protein